MGVRRNLGKIKNRQLIIPNACQKITKNYNGGGSENYFIYNCIFRNFRLYTFSNQLENIQKLSFDKLERKKKFTIWRQLIYLVLILLLAIYIIINNF